MENKTLPKIEIKITTCEGDKVTYESEDDDFIFNIAKSAGEHCGYTITPTKRKGGGDG